MRLVYILAFAAFVGGTIYGTVNHHRRSTVPVNATAICQDGGYGFGDQPCAAHGGVQWRR